MIDHFASIRRRYSKSGVPRVPCVPSIKNINEIKNPLDLNERTPQENDAVPGVPIARLDAVVGSGQGTPGTPGTKSRVPECHAENSLETHGIYVQGTLEHPEHQKINEYDAVENARAARLDGLGVANSRAPLIPTEIRAKIEAIETEARSKGWPVELLYNANFWDCPRGPPALMDPDDGIVELTGDAITI